MQGIGALLGERRILQSREQEGNTSRQTPLCLHPRKLGQQGLIQVPAGVSVWLSFLGVLPMGSEAWAT